MDLKFYLEKLHSSKEFKEFIQNNKKAYLCSGFFLLDLEKDTNEIHFDYFVPKEDKIFSFKINSEIKKVPIENLNKKIPKELLLNCNLNFKEIVKILSKKIEIEKIKSKMQRILLSLQNDGKKNFLIGTIFISKLGIIKMGFDIYNKKLLYFEKKNFFDMFKILKKK
jgi:hypothetical protein